MSASQLEAVSRQADAARREFVYCQGGLRDPSMMHSGGQQTALRHAEVAACQYLRGRGFERASVSYFDFEVDRVLWNVLVGSTMAFPFTEHHVYKGSGTDWRTASPRSETYARFLDERDVETDELTLARDNIADKRLRTEEDILENIELDDTIDRSVFTATELQVWRPIPKALAGDKETLHCIWTTIFGGGPLFRGLNAFELPLLDIHEHLITPAAMDGARRFFLPGVKVAIVSGVRGVPCSMKLRLKLMENDIWDDNAVKGLAQTWHWMLIWWFETCELHSQGVTPGPWPDVTLARLHSQHLQGIRDSTVQVHKSAVSVWDSVWNG